MREYEVTIIVQPKLEEEPRNQLIARVSDLIAPGADEAHKPVENHWGIRRLAYPIRKHNEGYYVMFEAQIEPDQIKEIERALQFMEDVLRYLVVRKDQS